ncbi:MAG TPA: VOC family protein [Actinomycetes bacterium]|jgi:methylmalonyl-CoA epimerase|nr:VOC family protein [Actinomycetes bacterium]
MIRRIHHVAFAHPAGTTPWALREALGLEDVHEEPGDGFIERMIRVGEGFVQLLEPTGPGIIQRFLDRRGPSLHHVGFEVDDVAAAVSSLRRAGLPVVEPAPRPGGMGTAVAFVHPAAFNGLLIELVEPGGGKGS